MNKVAIFAYVQETLLTQYDNRATSGVPSVARKIMRELRPAFRDNNLIDLGPLTRADQIRDKFLDVSSKLDSDGLCFFYFHGHGDSVPGSIRSDEAKDQALVCHDRYLIDDHIDELLLTLGPKRRVLTIVDSCSSETVVEWSKQKSSDYPQIMHIASARDGEEAGALPGGGLFSRRILKLISGEEFKRFTYQSFAAKLKLYTVSAPCYVRTSTNMSNKFLQTKLFT